VRIRRQRYQKGSVRKILRSSGFAWQFRFYYTDTDRKRREKVQTFDSSSYATEFNLRNAVEGQMSALNEGTLAARVEVTFGNLITKYLNEVLPHLKHSTQDTNRSMIGLHIEPRWEACRFGGREWG